MRLRMRCKTPFNVPVVITATVVTVLVAMIILGGVRRTREPLPSLCLYGAGLCDDLNYHLNR